ncbi:MAG TPA: hypothetical protein DDZ53_05245 [Firmicutes bacterium]|nr:hypothetical protein [Bacillota bacterium]
MRMLKFELRRLFRRRKLLLLAILGFVLLMGGAVNYLDYGTSRRTSFEAFIFVTDLILPFLLPLFGGFATGDTLAVDRLIGLPALIMSRGVSPLTYILAKALGAVVGQVCLIAGILGVALLALMPFFPVGPLSMFSGGLVPDLAAVNPLLYCLSVSLVYITAAVAFCGVSLLLSIWVKNRFVVMASPVVLYIAALYALDVNSPLIAINPYAHLLLEQAAGAGFTLLGVIGYWALLRTFFYTAAVLAFSLQRDYV